MASFNGEKQRMKNLRKYIKFVTIIILFFIGTIVIYSLCLYFKEEQLLSYFKGTTKKAFLNATWKMSQQEVTIANGCELTEGYSLPVFEDDLNKSIDINRINSKKSCKINIWGDDRDVLYDFFDDQLFRIRIGGDIFNTKEIDSLIVTSLTPKYGIVERKEGKGYEGHFSTDEVEVDYFQFEYENDENKNMMRFYIELTYKPLLNEIKTKTKQRQENIF